MAVACAGKLGEQLLQIELEFDLRLAGGTWLSAEEVVACWQLAAEGRRAQHDPQLASYTIANHGRSERATERERHPRRRRAVWRIEEVGAPQHSGPSAPTIGRDAREGAALSDAPDQADRRCRPLARRAFNTARPARVLMRLRKPCFLARRRLFGW